MSFNRPAPSLADSVMTAGLLVSTEMIVSVPLAMASTAVKRGQLLGFADRCGAGSRRLTADIQNVGTVRNICSARAAPHQYQRADRGKADHHRKTSLGVTLRTPMMRGRLRSSNRAPQVTVRHLGT